MPSSDFIPAHPDPDGSKVYPSAVDAWMVAVLVGVPVLLFGLAIAKLEESRAMGVFLLCDAALMAAVMALFLVPCRYTLTREQFIIRCGVLRTEIALRDIDRIQRSGSWIAAPALSLRRVRIDHGVEYTLVSPRDRDRFVAELAAAVRRQRPSAPPVIR